jgi:hypothetical protein
MKWTCERCGLQVDDRRVPNDCSGVKGQAHEWEETNLYNEKQEKLKKWLSTPEAQMWREECTKINKSLNESIVSLQEKYLQASKKIEKIKDESLFSQKNEVENIDKENYEKCKKKSSKKFKRFCIIALVGFLLIRILSGSIIFASILGIFILILAFYFKGALNYVSVNDSYGFVRCKIMVKQDMWHGILAGEYYKEKGRIIEESKLAYQKNDLKYNVKMDHDISHDEEFENENKFNLRKIYFIQTEEGMKATENYFKDTFRILNNKGIPINEHTPGFSGWVGTDGFYNEVFSEYDKNIKIG